MRRVFILLTSAMGISFAHMKPYPHTHVGFLHPEDILMIVGAIGALAVGAFLALRVLRT